MESKTRLKRMDMHVHTRFSTEELNIGSLKISVKMTGDPQVLYHKAKDLGMDFVTFTDHNTIEGCLYLLEKMPHVDDFVISEEVTTKDPKYGFVIHVNVYDITKQQHKRITVLREDFNRLISYLKEQNILHCYNHPYWSKHHDYALQKPIKHVYELAKQFLVTEGINSFRLRQQNYMAREMAKSLGLGLVGGSDTHGGSIGRAYTLANSDNVKDFLKQVRLGKTFVQGKDYIFKDFYQECMNIFKANSMIIKNEYPSKRVKMLTSLLNPAAKIIIMGQIRKNTTIQRKIIRKMIKK